MTTTTATHADATADQATADLEARADAEAMRLAHTLPADQVAAAMHGTARRVAARLHGSTEETTARADALCRALRGIANGLDVAHAINAASRDAVADAVRRAAAETLWSLDATTGDGTTTLADMIDAEHIGTARLSQYDEQAGIYRGVARVPHPEDCTRPLEMPAPEQMQEAARDSLTPEARTLLDLTAAVNVAAEMQRRAYVAECADVARTVAADVAALAAGSRSRTASAARKTEKEARAALRLAKQDVSGRGTANPYRPRTSEVAAALGITSRGARTAKIGADQESAAAAYWTHRDALALAALDAWTERLDEAADTQRRTEAYRLTGVADWTDPAQVITAAHGTRWDRITTTALIHLCRAGARQQATAALDAASTLAAPQQPAGPAAGATLADPRDADHGTRPRRALAEWDNGRALPGSSRRPSARMASANEPASDPQRSRTHADDERQHRTALVSACPAPALPRPTAPGTASPVPALTMPDGSPIVARSANWTGTDGERPSDTRRAAWSAAQTPTTRRRTQRRLAASKARAART